MKNKFLRSILVTITFLVAVPKMQCMHNPEFLGTYLMCGATVAAITLTPVLACVAYCQRNKKTPQERYAYVPISNYNLDIYLQEQNKKKEKKEQANEKVNNAMIEVRQAEQEELRRARHQRDNLIQAQENEIETTRRQRQEFGKKKRR